MKYVETRGKIKTYEIILEELGMEISFQNLFSISRNDQFVDWNLDGKKMRTQIWKLPVMLYSIFLNKIGELKA